MAYFMKIRPMLTSRSSSQEHKWHQTEKYNVYKLTKLKSIKRYLTDINLALSPPNLRVVAFCFYLYLNYRLL